MRRCRNRVRSCFRRLICNFSYTMASRLLTALVSVLAASSVSAEYILPICYAELPKQVMKHCAIVLMVCVETATVWKSTGFPFGLDLGSKCHSWRLFSAAFSPSFGYCKWELYHLSHNVIVGTPQAWSENDWLDL